MVTRRRFLGGVVVAALAGCASGSNGDVTLESPGGLPVTSPAFEDGASIPTEYTGDGADRSPPLSIGGVSDPAVTLTVVADDPDAPSGTFVHWLLWNVPAERGEIPAGLPQEETLPSIGGARQGTNGFDEIGYRGPLPPSGDGPHTYRFTVYALDAELEVEAGARREALEAGLSGSVLASGRLSGEYER